MATIKDIAEYTKISKSTVSRALRDPKTVSPKKLIAIKNAIDELGYIPNYYATNLKTKTSKTIALHINETQNLFFNKLIDNLEKYLNREGYNLVVSYGNDEANNFVEKIKFLISLSPAALLFSPNILDPSLELMFNENKIFPIQLFSDVFPKIDSIVVDDNYGTYLATKRLLVSGCKKIMLIGLEGHVFENRLSGYKKALEEAGFVANDKYIIRITNNERLTDIIMSNIIRLNPDGIIAVANNIGLETQKILTNMKKKIPEDVSFIQYDDSPTAQLMNITVIGHTFDSISKLIISKIFSGLNNKKDATASKSIIEPILIERGSIISK